MEECRLVVLRGPRNREPPVLWRKVRPGQAVGSFTVLRAEPEECLVSRLTRIRVLSSECRFETEEQEDDVIIRKYCGGRPEVYVYPAKAWKLLHDLYVEPLSRGQAPRSPGVILHGPPGTGKTSLAKIVAEYAGVYTVEVAPEEVLSKWLGETEKFLKKKLEEAEEMAPSLVIVDDAEWLLSTRRFASMDDSGSAKVMLNVKNMLFRKMQEFYNKKLPILFIATTNVSLRELDPAFQRHGRFGDKIIVPLPSINAVKLVLESKGIGNAGETARLCISAGLSMADCLLYAEKRQLGLEEKPRATEGRGYKRIIARPVPNFEKLFNYIDRETVRRGRLHLLVGGEVGVAIASQLVSHAGRNAVMINDYRFIDEAVFSANTLNAVIILPASTPREFQEYVSMNAENGIMFVGEGGVEVEAIPFGAFEFVVGVVGPEAVTEAVLDYLGLDTSKKEMIVKAAGASTSTLLKVLRAIASAKNVDEKLIASIPKTF